MRALADMVSSLQDPKQKDFLEKQLSTRKLHPAEDLFARYALFALSPDFSSNMSERGEAAYYILKHSLGHLPPSPSSYAFMRELNKDIFYEPEAPIVEQIEKMVRLANVASLLQASYNNPEVQAVENVVREEWPSLVRLSAVAGQESAWPVVISKETLFLYSGNRDLLGICLDCLPGKSCGLPIVFACSEYFHDDKVDRDTVVRITCHEMIHSSQSANRQEEIEGWSPEAKTDLLEAITEGLNICRLGKSDPFSPEEISKRDYAYLVIVLFHAMREKGIADESFSDRLEKMNASSLLDAASLFESSEKFLGDVEHAKQALVLQHMRTLDASLDGRDNSLQIISDLLFPEGGGLEIISEVLAAKIQ